jgi:hypothetical protein
MATIWLLIFCIGIPAFIFVQLQFPEKLPNWTTHFDMTFLTVYYVPEYRWWEMVSFVRRAIIAVIVTVVLINQQLLAILFVIFAFVLFGVSVWCRPFLRTVDNLLEGLATACIVVTFCCEAWTIAYGDPNSAVLIFVCVLNLMMLLVLVMFLLIESVPVMVRRFKNLKEPTRQRARTLADAELMEHAHVAATLRHMDTTNVYDNKTEMSDEMTRSINIGKLNVADKSSAMLL